MKKLILPLVLAAGLGGAALAQVPALFLATPTGNEMMDVRVPSTGTATISPQITTIRMVQVRDAAGYLKAVPVSGATIPIPNTASRIALNPAGTLAALTVALPAAPVDGQVALIFSTQTITTLTIAPAAGQTINNALTTLAANTSANYIYSAANATWDRV